MLAAKVQFFCKLQEFRALFFFVCVWHDYTTEKKNTKNPAPCTLIGVAPFVHRGLTRVYTFQKCAPTLHPRKMPSLNLRIGKQSFAHTRTMICVGANGRLNGIYSLSERHLFLARTASIPYKALFGSVIDGIRINDKR